MQTESASGRIPTLVLMGWEFSREFARFGPSSGDTAVSLAGARGYCERVTRSHSENFTVASVLLPRRLLPHFHAVYAWCRWADDLADETGPAAAELLAWWRRELQACFEGTPSHPVTIALAETVRRFAIPPEPFLALLTAFQQDQRVRNYATFEDLLGYCRNSANPVGHLVLHLFECHTEDRARLADEICTGLQLANFWQDVRRDLDIGRVYIPEEDRRRFEYPDADLHARRFTTAFRDLMWFEVDRTRGFFERGKPLLELLPRSARIDVDLFLRGGSAVLDAIEQQRYDVWSRRPTVPGWKKAELLVRSVVGW